MGKIAKETQREGKGVTQDFPPALGLPGTLLTENSNLSRSQKRLKKQSTYSSVLSLCFSSFSLSPHFDPGFIIASAFPPTAEGKDVTLPQQCFTGAHSTQGK